MPDAPEPPRDSAIPSTREDLIRAAAALREEAARILEEAKENASARVAVAAAYERLAGLGVENSRLHTDDTVDTLGAMDVGTQAKNESVRRAIGRATRKHPAQVILYKAGLTIGQVAKELGEGRSRVSSWMSDGDGNRPIPRRHASMLLRKYRVPLSAWKRITD